MRKSFAALAFAIAFLSASSAQALLYNITSFMDGPSETPPNASPATATMTGTYDDVTNILLWSGSFSGMLTGTTNAHFHGPAAPGVGPAGVLWGATASTGDVFPLGVTSGSFSGSHTLTATQETQLLSGLTYFNIHTTGFPGGEVRGQVYAVPAPATLGLLALGLIGLARVGRRRS